MKLNMKRVLLVLCMVTCLFSLSACGKKAEEQPVQDAEKVAYLEQIGTALMQQIVEVGDDQYEELLSQVEKSGDVVLASGLESFQNVKGDLGAMVSIGSTTVEELEDGYQVCVDVVFEQRNVAFTMSVDEELSTYTSLSFSPVYTTSENMVRAGMNTLMGMGTVFLVLIFISLIIGCFRYINIWETKQKNKQAQLVSVPSTPEPAAIVEEENLTDDLELVAVITAAIAASADESTDGFVVRSIKRVPASKWKKA